MRLTPPCLASVRKSIGSSLHFTARIQANTKSSASTYFPILKNNLLCKRVANQQSCEHGFPCECCIANRTTFAELCLETRSPPASRHTRLVSKKSHNDRQCRERHRSAGSWAEPNCLSSVQYAWMEQAARREGWLTRRRTHKHDDASRQRKRLLSSTPVIGVPSAFDHTHTHHIPPLQCLRRSPERLVRHGKQKRRH